jgi:hypothetical protein
MTKDIQEHNKWLQSLNDHIQTTDQFNYHMQNIQFLQHERLIHLIVMSLVSILFCLFLIASIVLQLLPLYLLVLIFFVLDCFYIKHYYLLENTVQRWYTYANAYLKNTTQNNLP